MNTHPPGDSRRKSIRRADAGHPVRRNLLKSAGLSLTLPMLESTRSQAQESNATDSVDPNAPAKRLICVGSNLGLYRPALYPTKTGRAYETSQLLKPLARHRADMTVLSGFDHRSGNGHKNWDNYLCGNVVGKVTLDQIAAEAIGQSTRFGSLQLCAGDIPKQRMCFSRQGVPLPMANRPSAVYEKLFATGQSRERSEHLLRSGQSALDVVREDAKRLNKTVSGADRVKLDEYFTSLRALESQIGRQLSHLADNQTKVDYQLPPYDPIAPTMMLECEQIMFDLMGLALQTDASRVSTLFIAGLGQVFTFEGETLRAGYHALSHHGNDPDMIRDLIRVETEHMKCLARFVDQLKVKTDADGRPLLDSTLVMFGTGMGDASRHSNRDLPTLIVGGGLDHGQHIAAGSDQLLGNVYVSLLNHLGVSTDRFANAKGGLPQWA